MNQRIRTCFISATPGSNLRVLRQCLEAQHIKVLSADDIELGFDWASEINRNIMQADLVIGVLSRTRRSQWVLFELGLASAAGRQIILIAPPGTTDNLPPLRQFVVLRTRLDNRNAISFGLDQMLARPPRLPHQQELQKPAAPPPQQNIDVYINQLDEISKTKNYAALESLVAAALRDSSVEVVAENEPTKRRTDTRADLAVWSDALQPLVGNPLLVEVKYSIGSAKQVEDVVRRFAKTVSDAGGGWGLLVYLEGPESKLASWSQHPTLLMIPLRELLYRMRSHSFSEIIRELRNERVHGGRK
jgi:hypothetical protein